MKTSETVDQIAAALAKAQAQFDPVKKSGTNPYLETTYATLDDILRATAEALSDNGIALVQSLDENTTLTTVIFHESGQWIMSACAIPALESSSRAVNQLQTFGAALTYMRRYALAAMLGVSSGVDDDAESVKSAKPTRPVQQRPTQRKNEKDKKEQKQRPLNPGTLRRMLRAKAAGVGSSGTMPATEKQAPFVARKFTDAVGDQSDPTESYHLALRYLWTVDSAKELTLAQAKATLDWLLSEKGPDATGDTPLHEHAPEEARRVLREARKAQGQLDIFDE